MAGCKYVLHVASPFIITDPEDENEMISPAVDGTLRVLSAKAVGVSALLSHLHLSPSLLGSYRAITELIHGLIPTRDWNLCKEQNVAEQAA